VSHISVGWIIIHTTLSDTLLGAVLFLNFILFATYDTLPLVNSPLLQRMTQVLTVVMVSHLFLNLKLHAMRDNSSLYNEVVISSGGRVHVEQISLNSMDVSIARV